MILRRILQVDMRYRSINDSTYSVAVQLNGYYIATVIYQRSVIEVVIMILHIDACG